MAVSYLKGAHAIVVMSKRQPDRLVAVRIGNAGGVAVGLGEGENFIASDIPAILEQTRRMIFLESRQMVTVTANDACVQMLDGTPVEPQIHEIAWDPVSAAKGEYKHFMQKEIFEQARSITDTIRGRVDFEHETVLLPELNLTVEKAKALQRIVTVACGTSYFSGLVGKFFIEQIARLTVEVDYGSEYRYRDPIIDDKTAVLAITQSGETVDTLAAMEEAREKGATLWSIVNAIGSQAMRIADGYITMNAGPEIGVASTKAFTTSIVDQYLLALYLGQLRGTLSEADRRRYVHDIARLPDLVGQVLDQNAAVETAGRGNLSLHEFPLSGARDQLPDCARRRAQAQGDQLHPRRRLSGGRDEAWSDCADRRKHARAGDCGQGRALRQDDQPDRAGEGAQRHRDRLATEGDRFISSKADKVLYIPDAPPLLIPILAMIPLQLLAYHVAVRRGADVDQPRNLAKSVTVE